ncbi:hypothetical protein V498_07117 [Pseudogymnoascus sp. VKM F-4517 (FW-2822)]|nr:hypothetical protein V498_07117 [Pseudogymnoascus sp. VKM F-4517 (FW-2822)]
MGFKFYPRDYYDLWYSRARKTSRAGVEEPQDTIDARKNENERTNNLNYISKDLRIALEKNYALVSGINFGAHLLLRAADDTESLEQPRRPLESGPSRRDTEVEYLVIHARLRRASDLAKVLADTLKQINQAILRESIDSAIPSQEPTVQEPTVFYRVCHRGSHTSYGIDLGFWSAKGLPDNDFAKPSKAEFTSHVEGVQLRFRSPYISLTTDPGFVCEYGNLGDGQFVYEIDAAKLRQMKVHIESTSVLAKGWRIRYKGPDPGRLHNVIDTHWLARFWIPAECIMRAHSFKEFREKCIKAGFVDGKTNKRIKTGLPADAHEKLAALIKEARGGVAQEFVDDSDDETTRSVRPLTPDVPNPGLNLRPKPPTPRPARGSKPTAVNDDKVGEASTQPQNTTPADSGLDQRPKPPTPRPARGSKPTAVNDDKVGEASTQPQNTTPADSELEQSLRALSVADT